VDDFDKAELDTEKASTHSMKTEMQLDADDVVDPAD
jgi:hypothetical protein